MAACFPHRTSSNLDEESSDATQDVTAVFATMLPPRCASAVSEGNYCSDTPDYTIPFSPSPTSHNDTEFSFMPNSTEPVQAFPHSHLLQHPSYFLLLSRNAQHEEGKHIKEN